jgi:hypothetical protein
VELVRTPLTAEPVPSTGAEADAGAGASADRSEAEPTEGESPAITVDQFLDRVTFDFDRSEEAGASEHAGTSEDAGTSA